MRGSGISRGGVLVLVAAVMLLAAHLGLSRILGAHPWWAVKVVYIGVAIGVGLSLLVHRWRGGRAVKIALWGGLLAVAVAVTVVGKAQFVASYGDDHLAGRMWFLGWIASAAFLYAALVEGAAGAR